MNLWHPGVGYTLDVKMIKGTLSEVTFTKMSCKKRIKQNQRAVIAARDGVFPWRAAVVKGCLKNRLLLVLHTF